MELFAALSLSSFYADSQCGSKNDWALCTYGLDGSAPHWEGRRAFALVGVSKGATGERGNNLDLPANCNANSMSDYRGDHGAFCNGLVYCAE